MLLSVGPFGNRLCYLTGLTCTEIGIWGYTAPGFERVRDDFEQIFKAGNEKNAQVTAYYRGEKVVDLWGTYDKAGDPHYRDTVQLVFSTSKVVESIAVSRLENKGSLDYHDVVMKHWPEFGANGKESIIIGDILQSISGLQSVKPFENRTLDSFLDVAQVYEEMTPDYPTSVLNATGHNVTTNKWYTTSIPLFLFT